MEQISNYMLMGMFALGGFVLLGIAVWVGWSWWMRRGQMRGG